MGKLGRVAMRIKTKYLIVICFLFAFTGVACIEETGGEKTYWDNGKIKSEITYKKVDNLEYKYVTKWDENESAISSSTYTGKIKVWETHFKDGKKHGLEREWDFNGRKISKTMYREGEKHGLETKWRGGDKEYEVTYRNGKKHGLETEWSSMGGNKNYERHYVDGIENGIRREWGWRHPEYGFGESTWVLKYQGNYVDGAEE
jgi:antitoxin component YwqK of YwqJK toxin-antitoxin module